MPPNACPGQSDRPGHCVEGIVSISTLFGQSDGAAIESLAAQLNAAAERDHPVTGDRIRIDVTAERKRQAMNIGAQAEVKLPIRVQRASVSDARLVAGSAFNSSAL